MKNWMKGSIIKKVVISLLGIFVLISIFAPFLANDRPILCKHSERGWHFTLFDHQKSPDCEKVIWPLIRYNYSNIDGNNSNFVSPGGEQNLGDGQQRHFLGTDQLGRDVASGMIHGSRIALMTGSFSMLIALIIGLFFGLIGAYYGNDQLRIRRMDLFLILLSLFLVIYMFNYVSLIFSSTIWTLGFLLFSSVLMILFYFILSRFKYFREKTTLALDLIFSSMIEIFQSIPGSFLILILVSLFTKASIYNVILVIGLLRWPMIARYVRAEMLKIKEQRYIEASKAIGMSDLRILFKHALPATLTPVIVAVAFGFSSAILLESALSFLGIGLPADHVSYGSMLSEARQNYQAWWMAFFPGLAIFLLIFIFNYLGDLLSKELDKK